MTKYDYIKLSGYGLEFNIAVCVIVDSEYIPYEDMTNKEYISHVEEFVMENGVFVGGMSKLGCFFVADREDFVDCFYMAITGNPIPTTSFHKKIIDLYVSSTLKMM